MQYTIRGIPKAVDRALRERAARENRSINQVALEAMAHGLGVDARAPLNWSLRLGASSAVAPAAWPSQGWDGFAPVKRRELGDLAGAWVKDKAVDQALADQRRIDEAIWR